MRIARFLIEVVFKALALMAIYIILLVIHLNFI